MKITNKSYDILKWIAQYFLPGAGTLYFALSSIWGLPYGEQVVGTVAAIDTFLGVILGLSSAKYSGDGDLLIDQTGTDKDIYRIEVDGPLETLKTKEKVTLIVKPDSRLS